MTASAGSGARAVGLAATADALGATDPEGDAAGVATGTEVGGGDGDATGEHALMTSAKSAVRAMYRRSLMLDGALSER